MIGYLIVGLQGSTGETPLWLQNIRTGAGIFQASITGLALIVGGIFAYYRFIKEEPYTDQLQPSVSTAVSYSANHFLVVITANVENAGQVQVELDKSRTRLVTATRSLGEPGWTPFAPLGIFHEQSAVQSNETISDQVWIEIPDDDLVALRTDFVVARVVTEEERRKGGNVIWGWEARDIVNLLDIKGNITDTSDSDAERGQ